MSRDIAVPAGTDIKISVRPPFYLVVAAPPPMKADLDLLLRPGLSGMFTFDPGVTWPDRSGCRYAEGYLREGVPIVLEFSHLIDALTCQKRLQKAADR